MRLYASDEDTVVPRQLHTDRLVASVGCGVIACRGQHGDPSHYRPGDVSMWLRAVLGQ